MHEIIVDPNFKLQTHQPQSALEERVKSIATQAFFDKLAEDIRSGNAEQSIASIMEDVRKSLLDLAKSSTTLYKQLDDMMDMDLIRQNLSKGTFDLDMMLKDIVQVMLRICAPVRDETIQNISTMDDPVQQLRAILAVLDEMTLDLINFRIRMLRPHLTPMAVEYERSDFAEALAQGKTGLAKTRAWIRNTKQRLDETAVERNKKDRDLSVTAVFEEALVSFITSAEPLSPMTCPETLLLDIHRLSQCQNEIQATSMVASLLLLARNFKVPNHAFDSMAKRFFVLLKDHTTHIDHLSGEIEKHADIDAAHLPLIRSMVDKTLSHDDAVYALLTRRIGTVVRSSISNGQFVDSATLATHGLEHVRRPLRELCQRLIPLARHNFQVYLPWYKEIIME
ncbi:T-complex 11 [Radiomyces spectabilis]|uniref:T-complex 11 n=1 Tax=Radiomyces spectabilis TaxID=64574 RepID=UPI002220B2DC|nr:T-complex 11 [Radiomyces spectabilis]KAI8391078.1 T-complex 11 [Radiomyces spectabilis]